MIESEGTPRGPSSAASRGGPQGTGAFVVEGPIDRDDIPALCARVTRFIAGIDGHGETIVCELTRTVTPTGDTVEALARLQLTALRLGHRLQLGPCCPTLRTMLDHIGFSEVIPDAPGSVDEKGSQAGQDGSHV